MAKVDLWITLDLFFRRWADGVGGSLWLGLQPHIHEDELARWMLGDGDDLAESARVRHAQVEPRLYREDAPGAPEKDKLLPVPFSADARIAVRLAAADGTSPVPFPFPSSTEPKPSKFSTSLPSARIMAGRGKH